MNRTGVRAEKTVAQVLEEYTNEAFSNVETGFIGRMVRVSDDLMTGDVQPLRQIPDANGSPVNVAVLEEVPIADQAAWRMKPYIAPRIEAETTVTDLPCGLGEVNATIAETKIIYTDGPDGAGEDPDTDHWQNTGHCYFEKLKVGDMVFCLCCSRMIDEAIDGTAAPDRGEPSMNNALVIASYAFDDREPVRG